MGPLYRAERRFFSFLSIPAQRTRSYFPESGEKQAECPPVGNSSQLPGAGQGGWETGGDTGWEKVTASRASAADRARQEEPGERWHFPGTSLWAGSHLPPPAACALSPQARGLA